MPERISQPSMHPMIQFKVIGYRVSSIDNAVMQEKPKPIPIEAMREYHIGLVYPHKPIHEGVLFTLTQIPGAELSEEYMKAFRASEYKDHFNFCVFQLLNCEHCIHKGPYELIDERKAPGA